MIPDVPRWIIQSLAVLSSLSSVRQNQAGCQTTPRRIPYFSSCLIILLAGCSAAAPIVLSTPTPVVTTPTRSVTPTAIIQPPPRASEIAQGIEVYKATYCGICHTLDAVQSRGIFGPTHNGMAATAAARIASEGYSGAATTAAEYLRESILNPGVYLVDGYAATRHPMPAYTHLPAAEVDALVYLLLQQ
jgi:mono/diheme cytochrome c family protein